MEINRNLVLFFLYSVCLAGIWYFIGQGVGHNDGRAEMATMCNIMHKNVEGVCVDWRCDTVGCGCFVPTEGGATINQSELTKP
jgi:hypothetical protein